MEKYSQPLSGSTYQNTVMYTHRKVIIIALSIVVVVLYTALFYILFFRTTSTTKKSASQITAIPTSIPLSRSQQKAKPAPVVSFSSYTNQATVPTIPFVLKTYTLKTDFSLDETKAFAKEFGLTLYKATDQDNPVFYSEQKETGGVMVFNKTTGIFSYQSFGTLKTKTLGTNAEVTAIDFLKQINIYDETISCNITYKRKQLPQDLTFVECHRMPERLGTILLNPVGILNLPEQTKLSSLRVGYVGTDGPVDKTIENVSTGENGKARPNDFNTITVGVFSDGNIFSVDSTIRWMQEKIMPTIIPQQSLILPQEAILQFKRQKAAFSLTIPAGQGTMDWNTVYPENKAEAEIATITDYTLVYTENAQRYKQTTYTPSYLIRGTARLKSGYMVRFVQTLPATKNTAVLGEADDTIRLDAFYPTKTPTPTKAQSSVVVTPTPVSTLPSPTTFPTEPAKEFKECVVAGDRTIVKESIINISGYGSIILVSYMHEPNTYFLKSSNFALKDMDELREKLEKEYSVNSALFDNIEGFLFWLQPDGTLHKFGYDNSSSCYITGYSPAIFIYSEKQEDVNITLPKSITYTDPPTSIGSWSTNNNYSRDYIYYEYDASKVIFAEPKEGYVVKKDAWEKAVNTITQQLTLTRKEQQALVIDIQNALPKITTPYMKISIVNEQEIANKLPLNISPIPDSIRRIHLLLSPQRGFFTPSTPVLSPLVRNGFTIVEVGVAVGK